MKTLAPILLFVYNRPIHTQKTIQALQANNLAIESDLYIYSDAPKNNTALIAVNEVREYIKTIKGFKSINIIKRESNYGLAKSIISGVTEIINKHGNVIVLEDDLITTPNFLDFMNSALNNYKHTHNIFSISGFSFNLGISDKEIDTYFLNRGWSWGWATWRDRWEKVDWNVSDYLDFIKSKQEQRKFGKGGSDLNGMLAKQMNGKLDSWAIRWFYNQYKLDGLTVYPIKSKILNGGFGADATHTTGSSERYIPDLDIKHQRNFNFDNSNKLTHKAQRKFQFKMGIISRIVSKLQTLLKI